MKHYFINSVFGILLSASLLTSCKKDNRDFRSAMTSKSDINTVTTNNDGSVSSALVGLSANKGKGPTGLVIIYFPDSTKAH